MITLHLDRTLLLSFLGAEAVAVLGMALFLWWAIRAVGLFRAAAAGKAFADSVEEARASVNAAAARAATQIASHDEKVLELIQQAAEVSKRLKQVTPQSIQTMVDDAAARKAAELTAQHAAARKAAEAEAKALKKLVEALTGSPKALAIYVRSGLPKELDPQLRGQVIAFCAARGIDVGRDDGRGLGGM
jgi:hypothetical protein